MEISSVPLVPEAFPAAHNLRPTPKHTTARETKTSGTHGYIDNLVLDTSSDFEGVQEEFKNQIPLFTNRFPLKMWTEVNDLA